VLNPDVLQAQMGASSADSMSSTRELPAINDQHEEAGLFARGRSVAPAV